MKIQDYPTPETDLRADDECQDYYGMKFEGVHADFARLVERRLAACREVLEELARYVVASAYPDGPCIESEDMKAIKEVLEQTKL